MSGPDGGADTAFRVADRLKSLDRPWDVFAERARRYEVHLNGSRVELARGPILLEGYGIRVLRARGEVLGTGFQASTDLSDEGIRRTVTDAEMVARYASFPAPKADVPAGEPAREHPEIRDREVWDDPAGALDRHIAALVAAFAPEKDVVPSFGSIKVTLTEVTIANSQGLTSAYAHTLVESELAVKAFGGPEGRPPGEYWVTDSARRLETSLLPARVREWSRFARDVRRARAPPNGDMPVVLPPDVLEGILPAVLAFRLSGAARLRGLATEAGTEVGGASLQIRDDGLVPWAVGSSPVDDEGIPQRRRDVIRDGRVGELLYDVLHGSALGAASSGSARRGSMYRVSWGHFRHAPGPSASTIVVPAGNDGTDEELIERAGDGIWVQQIGWAQPEPISGSFGGEIRIGYRIRNGKLAEPIRGGTVGGMVLAPPGAASLLRDLNGVGSRPVLTGGAFLPPLLIGKLTVAGESTGATASP